MTKCDYLILGALIAKARKRFEHPLLTIKLASIYIYM